MEKFIMNNPMVVSIIRTVMYIVTGNR